MHRRIAERLLKKVTYPLYLQGSLPKRDYLGNAAIHTNSTCIISQDVKNFFPSISKNTVVQVWKNVFKFPEDISEILAELITYEGFLVQGCITSSYICNLVLWNRESKLVDELKEKGFTYTRYVDDITVSSKRIFTLEEKKEIIKSIHSMLKSISVKLNRRKHKIMPRNSQQQVHRVNVNSDRTTMPKSEREKIKAAVHQCEELYKTLAETEEYKKLFNQTLGRVVHLSRLHERQGKKLKQKLSKIYPRK
ncbi:reverse transcriptase family protein [Pasteurella multocida]|uniref:reverse transcriptase family protein n=1 Tax=Pasteurella multocida TaxID=747 RepID=UPI001E4FB4A6|nr:MULTISPECIES: reverse transcriptase family protein [Pasteurella]MCH4804257.1 reverse transcriptase family protein [Pasteurella multocida]MCL7758097.1 reverse transcriptase family protein [Pasteurella multocida]MCL7819882.1 reverse transcriptase family protein [Pasteurella multocida]MCL7822762.1 reverse transcriptase family protein [Pasteurella multocida]MCL7825830.1 reverse transcriptase family protein [Pasteurella multocida]